MRTNSCRTLPPNGRVYSRSGLSTAGIIMIVLSIVAVIVLVLIGIVVAVIYPAFNEARGNAVAAAGRAASRNNLKQIGLAIHNYHDVYAALPPGGIYGEDGTPHHSFMTALLPFLEQSPLYDRIDRNTPWNSGQNQANFAVPLQVYLSPEITASRSGNRTTAEGFAISHFAGNRDLLSDNGDTRFQDVTDGLSYTMLAAQVPAGFLAWGDPENRRSLLNGVGTGNDQFGHPTSSSFQILMADGSVRDVSLQTDADTLRRLGIPDDGEPMAEF